MKKKHLDLGCGFNPRNPYNADELYGIDLHEQHKSISDNFTYTSVNLILEKIPFEDNYFDSISAYDFIEHIPRLINYENKIIFPFIELMNEIYRVLKPNGNFYALTPAYPMESAFVDPTHVNIITKKTHNYFTTPHNTARMYGFHGNFLKLRSEMVHFSFEVSKKISTRLPVIGSLRNNLTQKIILELYPRWKQHLLWEFKSIK
jgi:SAM-dependent methyltransferase